MKKSHLLLIILSLVLILGACTEKAETPEQIESTPVEMTNSGDVAKIEGTTFTDKDMEFYSLMQVIELELARANVAKNLEGEALDESDAYWDEEIRRLDNQNIQLQRLIEIHAMSLLGKEKNYYIPPDKLEMKIADFNYAVAENDTIRKLLRQFGENEVNGRLHIYFEKVMLVDRIVADIEQAVREELPEASDKEVSYEVSKRYEDLYIDQIASLEREIYMR